MSGAGVRHVPERRCVGCGARAPQTALLRLAVERTTGSVVVRVSSGKARTGRGAYICRRRACLDRALQRKAFQRAFRENVTVDSDGIVAALEAAAPMGSNDNDTAGG